MNIKQNMLSAKGDKDYNHTSLPKGLLLTSVLAVRIVKVIHVFFSYVPWTGITTGKSNTWLKKVNLLSLRRHRPECPPASLYLGQNQNREIREGIPVPDGVRKETTFICFYSSRGYLKCHGMLIVRSFYFLKQKFQASNHLLWLYSTVCVRPGKTARFSHDAAHME